MKKEYFVEVVGYKDGIVIERIGPMTKRRTEKVERGVDINLDHSMYYTRTVKESKEVE